MREEGYYWVKESDSGWFVAHWGEASLSGYSWSIPGLEYDVYDEQLDEIDERRIVRGDSGE